VVALKEKEALLRELVEKVERERAFCRAEREEVRKAGERLLETAKVIRSLLEENSEEVISKVFEEADIVEEILKHIEELEKCEEELNEDVKALLSLLKEVVLSSKPPSPREFEHFKREES